jgi:hypothetical protein
MLKQIDFTYQGIEYCILYDSNYMTDEQAELECEFVDWGMGHDETLYPYYLIVHKKKAPILSCIREFIEDRYHLINF